MKPYLLYIFLFVIAGVSSCFGFLPGGLAYGGETKCGFHLNFDSNKDLKNKHEITWDSSSKPVLPKTYLSKPGRFRIHYDVAGINAVPPEDVNNDGIPDYIDSVAFYFEYAYNVEVLCLGYVSPIYDSSGTIVPYDVYLLEDTLGFYGFTVKDKNVSTSKGYPKWTSFIIIDNDFSIKDSIYIDKNVKRKAYTVTGISAVKVTAAHEFHHAIQLKNGLDPDTQSLCEFSSSYMEYRLFPEIHDYFQYVRKLFGNLSSFPFGDGYYENGYMHSIFGQYIQSVFGDSLLLRMWEIMGNGVSGYTSLDNAFGERNTSLVNEWKNYMPWIYYTGYRAIHGKFFENAAEFPEFKFYDSDTTLTPPSYSKSGELKPFEIRAHRCRIKAWDNSSPDIILDIVLTNTDIEAAKNQKYRERPMPYRLVCSDNPANNSIKVNNTAYYYSFNAPEGSVFDTLFYDRGDQIGYTYPNPFNPRLNDELLFPVPANANLREKVQLNIFDVNMTVVYSELLKVTLNNVNRVVILNNLPDALTSGVYMFTVSCRGDQIMGKFSVIR